MKILLNALLLSFFIIGCEKSPEFVIDGTENFENLSTRIDLQKLEPESESLIYQYGKSPDSLLGISFDDIPLTSDQYVFNKKSGQLCNVQFFIPKESNRELIIKRLNQNEKFTFIDTGDTFMFTRRMQWTTDNNKTLLILTSVANSNKSHLSVDFEKTACDLY